MHIKTIEGLLGVKTNMNMLEVWTIVYSQENGEEEPEHEN